MQTFEHPLAFLKYLLGASLIQHDIVHVRGAGMGLFDIQFQFKSLYRVLLSNFLFDETVWRLCDCIEEVVKQTSTCARQYVSSKQLIDSFPSTIPPPAIEYEVIELGSRFGS